MGDSSPLLPSVLLNTAVGRSKFARLSVEALREVFFQAVVACFGSGWA